MIPDIESMLNRSLPPEFRREEPPWEPFVPDPAARPAANMTYLNNNLYRVQFHRNRSEAHGGRVLLCLRVIRRDGRATHDWRHLQRIKNELVGPEQEMCELFPAESRLMDCSNAFWLWGLEGVRFAFGFAERQINHSGWLSGEKQRPFPADCMPPELAGGR